MLPTYAFVHQECKPFELTEPHPKKFSAGDMDCKQFHSTFLNGTCERCLCKHFFGLAKIHKSGVTFCGMCLFMNVFEGRSTDSTLLGKTLCYQIKNLNIQTGSLLLSSCQHSVA